VKIYAGAVPTVYIELGSNFALSNADRIIYFLAPAAAEERFRRIQGINA